MPNHIHSIIIIKQPVGAALRGRLSINMGLKLNNISNKNRISDGGPSQGPSLAKLSLPDIVCRFKSLTTKCYIDGVKNNNWQPFNKHLWQRSYYDHIIRSNKSLKRIREYISGNPVNWKQDIDNLINL